MLHKSLLNQIIFPIIVLFISMAAGLFVIYCEITDTNTARVEQTLYKGLAEQIIHYSDDLQEGKISRSALEPAFHSLMLLGPSYEIYITDMQGQLQVYAADPAVIKRNSIGTAPLEAFISGSNFPIYADNPRSETLQKLFSAAPIYRDNAQIGYVFVILAGDKYDSVVKDMSVDSDVYKILFALITFFLLALMLLGFIFARIVKPISQLDTDMTNFVNADFSRVSATPPSKNAAKEIINLHNNFASLEGKIYNQLTQIKSTEQLRREMLSHISHDLKTPLASLKGYLETWLIQYGNAAGVDFIKVAEKNANQLQRLVEQIIELAQLDSNTVSLYQEPVAIAELAQDVLSKFQLQAEKQHVALSVEPKDPSLQAIADIAKLERVLTNLVDNALRHCQDGDSIKIQLKHKNNQVIISIADSGMGIPKEEVNKIFDAHYRAKNTINGSQGNSGLGLAIVEKLLSLHHSKITVTSVLTKGTTFSFALPARA